MPVSFIFKLLFTSDIDSIHHYRPVQSSLTIHRRSGIFISSKDVLPETQPVGLCLIIWVACGLVSSLGALCYAEIDTVISKHGAEIAYLKEGIFNVWF
ncbi:unnamed protein product [Rotaria sp. Silwood1]|nr:unnamed protein product [Rotaria sp. Silwood1]CAF1535554.1 unnamed protein product [Rotaria sp. Silwood1]CAF3668773.1 unnamed protein product [Rotaria sp. Silwood1]CAF4987328.1 unnamed protein product [Rotaria sp. Silwood1]